MVYIAHCHTPTHPPLPMWSLKASPSPTPTPFLWHLSVECFDLVLYHVNGLLYSTPIWSSAKDAHKLENDCSSCSFFIQVLHILFFSLRKSICELMVNTQMVRWGESAKNCFECTNYQEVDHNDPSKPSYRLTNGPEPSKTIESDGSNIKKHRKTMDGNGQTAQKTFNGDGLLKNH